MSKQVNLRWSNTSDKISATRNKIWFQRMHALTQTSSLRACSYGQKLSRLARKHFEEFISEISSCYENNMKSYIVFIWGKTFPVYPDLACWQARSRSTGKFLSHMNTTFPLSEKTFCLHFTKSCHSGKLYPVSEITFLHMNRTKLFDSSKCFLANRDNFCPYEQALIRSKLWAISVISST